MLIEFARIRTRGQEHEETRSGTDETREQAHEAETAAHHAELELDRSEQLRKLGLTPEREYQKARAEAARLRSAADSRVLAVERYGRQQSTRDSDRQTRVKSLEAEMAKLESQIPTLQAAIDRLTYEIERRRVRAPMDGRLGEAAILRPGSLIHEGDKLGAIIPSGRLAAVAQFAPEAALGRVRAGQHARLRLDGFPWMQFGSVAATVFKVASEVREGQVRVEFAIEPDPHSRIPLQHGLPGTVEVQVERANPWTLVMRHAGRMLARPLPVQPVLHAEVR